MAELIGLSPRRPAGIDKQWFRAPKSLGVAGQEEWLNPSTHVCVVSAVRHEQPLANLPRVPYYRLEMSVFGREAVPESLISATLRDFGMQDAERDRKTDGKVHAVFWIPVSELKEPS